MTVRPLAHARTWPRLFTAVLIAVLAMTVTPTAASAADNSPPATPENPDVAGKGCAADAPGPYLSPLRVSPTEALPFSADIADPDPGDTLTALFDFWPVADPTQGFTVELRADEPRVTARISGGMFTDGATYAWTVRATDGAATSPETTPCYFTVDKTRPVRPAVTSTDYPSGTPSGGPTVPGEFTFSTNGSTDAVRFGYRLWDESEWHFVDADQSGSATVSITPTDVGFTVLYVHAVDRAENWGEPNNYGFDVREQTVAADAERPAVAAGEYRFTWSEPRSTYINIDGVSPSIARSGADTSGFWSEITTYRFTAA